MHTFCLDDPVPNFVEYQNKLYIPDFFISPQNEYVTPGSLIAKMVTGNIYFQKGTDVLNSICVQSRNFPSKYFGYSYFCDNTVQINGMTYQFVSGRNKSSKSAYGSQSDIIPADDASFPASIDSIDSSPTCDEDYYITLVTNNGKSEKQMAAIQDKTVGMIGGAVAYSIDEINPSQALIVKLGKDTFFVVTKRYNNTGKTIENVLADKGLN